MSNTFDDAITVFATGISLTTAVTASAATAIPVASSGERPRYLRVAATSPACFKMGGAGVSATINDMQVQPGDAVNLAVNGATHFSVIQVSAAGKVQVSPLENM